MKQVLCSAIIIMMVTAIYLPAQNKKVTEKKEVTLKSQMEALHERFGVNFVYDSSIDLYIPCPEIKFDKTGLQLEDCLTIVFKDTGIGYKIMKKYIVLSRKGSGHKSKDYTIFIEEQHDTLDESVITALTDRHRNETQTGLKIIDGSRFRNTTALLSSPDIIKEIQILPGVAGGNELLSGMYVHGGDGTDNLFLLDGVPIYQVSHLAGLISSFNTEMIDDLDFYKSGFPSRYGGKLSSVIDINTRKGDFNDYHGSFNIGLLNGSIQFEGPIVPGMTSFNIGIRRSWYDFITIPGMAIRNLSLKYGEKDRLRYAMTDFNGSVTHLFSKDNKLSLNLYTGTDILRFGHEEARIEYWEGTGYTGTDNNDFSTRWGNILASLNWDMRFSGQGHLNTIVYYTCSSNKVVFDMSQWEMAKTEPVILEMKMNEKNKGALHDIAVKSGLYYDAGQRHRIRTGISLVMHMFRMTRAVEGITRTSNPDEDVSVDSETNIQPFEGRYFSPELAVYFEDEMTLTKWLKANLGVRYVMFMTGDRARHSLEPRAAVNFQISPKASIRLSYSEMSQFLHNLRANYVDIPLSCWVPSSESVPPMRSRQIAGGVYTRILDNLVLNIEGFWKQMDNLTEYCGTDSIYPNFSLWNHLLMKGKGRSWGAEIESSWKHKGTEISASYTLSWSERFFEGIWHDWYPDRNDNRHKITISASHRFNKRFDMYLGWIYHTGNRMTIPTQAIGKEVYYSSPYNYRLPDYHRLDVGFNFRKTTRRGNESIWNLNLYNAYCRMNPMFIQLYRQNTEEGWISELKTLSVIPVIPSFSYTLRF